ncbi:MAG: lysozyme inhibitor LprI family protein [Pseudomonadota bacterium]
MRQRLAILRALFAVALLSFAATARAQDGIAACVEAASEVEACLGHAYNACLGTLPPPEDDDPMFTWKENDRFCWAAETAQWDALLNRTYGDLISGIGTTFPDAPEQLRRAQRAWIVFRDAECAWPSAFLRQNDLHNVEIACTAELTAERVARLVHMGAFIP